MAHIWMRHYDDYHKYVIFENNRNVAGLNFYQSLPPSSIKTFLYQNWGMNYTSYQWINNTLNYKATTGSTYNNSISNFIFVTTDPKFDKSKTYKIKLNADIQASNANNYNIDYLSGEKTIYSNLPSGTNKNILINKRDNTYSFNLTTTIDYISFLTAVFHSGGYYGATVSCKLTIHDLILYWK